VDFSRIAEFYDELFSQYRDYPGEARTVGELAQAQSPAARSLLDVACGTGLPLVHMRDMFEVEGLDISPVMAELARRKNPGVRIHEGDMRFFDLGRSYDVVTCLYSSITYAGSVRGLDLVCKSIAKHLKPGGVCVIEPFVFREDWKDETTSPVRSLERPGLTVAMVDRATHKVGHVQREIVYSIVRENGIEVIRDEYDFPLFSRSEYERALKAAGFNAYFDSAGFRNSRGLFVGKKIGMRNKGMEIDE